MTAPTREQLLAFGYPAPAPVALPDGRTVYVRVISGAERDAWEQAIAAEQARGAVDNVMGRFLALALANDDGTRLCTDADATALGMMAHTVVRRLFNAAVEHNALGPDAVADSEKN